MRSRCSLYVDAGYLLASLATRATGTSLRNGIHVDYPRLIRGLVEQAESKAGTSLLRVHWYDSAKDGVPDLQQERIGELPRVKLRLGRFGYDGQQKGVDVRIGLDLVAHARNNTADVFFLLSGDDDLPEAVEEAQVHGVQVIVLAVPNAQGKPHGVSRHLLRAADELVMLAAETADDSVMRVAVPPWAAVTGATAAKQAGTPAASPAGAVAPDDIAAAGVDLAGVALAGVALAGVALAGAALATDPSVDTGAPGDAALDRPDLDQPDLDQPDLDQPGLDQPDAEPAPPLTGAALPATPAGLAPAPHPAGTGPAAAHPEPHPRPARPTPADLMYRPRPTPPPAHPRLLHPVAPPATSVLAYSGQTGGQAEVYREPLITLDMPGVAEQIDAVVGRVLTTLATSASPQDRAAIRAGRPQIPVEIDRALLLDLSDALDFYDLSDPIRFRLRERFWALLDGGEL